MCWSSVTCSWLVSYAHWALGRGKALMFRDLLQLKSSAEPVTVAVRCTVWNLSLASSQAFGFFFLLWWALVCEQEMDAERCACGWSRTLLPILSCSHFSYLLNSCGWPLSVWCQLCSDEICPCSIWIYSNVLQICAWKVFSLCFFFSPCPLPFPVKVLSPGTYISATQIFITPCWLCGISCCRGWSLVQNSVKPVKKEVTFSSTGFNQTFDPLGQVGQASDSLA